MKVIHEDAEAALLQSSEQTKNQHDWHARPSREFSPGSKVYLEATNLKTNRPLQKLDDKWYGPFRVKEKVGRAAYELELPPTWPAIHPVFMNRFSPCIDLLIERYHQDYPDRPGPRQHVRALMPLT
jgi:hypothetical protein